MAINVPGTLAVRKAFINSQIHSAFIEQLLYYKHFTGNWFHLNNRFPQESSKELEIYIQRKEKEISLQCRVGHWTKLTEGERHAFCWIGHGREERTFWGSIPIRKFPAVNWVNLLSSASPGAPIVTILNKGTPTHIGRRDRCRRAKKKDKYQLQCPIEASCAEYLACNPEKQLLLLPFYKFKIRYLSKATQLVSHRAGIQICGFQKLFPSAIRRKTSMFDFIWIWHCKETSASLGLGRVFEDDLEILKAILTKRWPILTPVLT